MRWQLVCSVVFCGQFITGPLDASSGIVVTGGGALLAGFDRYVTERTSVPCRIAEDPISCVALGTGRVLDDLKKYNAAIYDYRRGEYYDS